MINKDELLLVVDKNNNPIEPLPRWQVHSEGYWHRNSHLWVRNRKGEILCQQRSPLKDNNPGKWEAFFGGHVESKSDYLDTVIRETKEEIGINVAESDLAFFKIYKSESMKEFIAIYLLTWDGKAEDLDFEKDEISRLKWFDFAELKKILAEKNPGWSNTGYEEEMVDWMSH